MDVNVSRVGEPPAGDLSRRRPQQRRSRAKVDAVLDAAEELLTERTLDSVTTTQVARRAGMAVGTLYQYFDGMPAVAEALAERHTLAFGAHLQSVLRGRSIDRKRDAANGALDALIAYYRAEPAFRSLWHAGPMTHARFSDATDFFMGIVVEAILERDLVELDEDFAREVQVQGALASSLLRLAFQRDPAGDRAVLDHLRKLFALDVVPVVAG
jgi:AcrR family transcriptional regulator